MLNWSTEANPPMDRVVRLLVRAVGADPEAG
jgi:hypothetical protein